MTIPPYVSRSLMLNTNLLQSHVQFTDEHEVTFVSMFSEGFRCLIACKVKDKNIGVIIIWDFEVNAEQPQTVLTVKDFKGAISMIRRRIEN